MNAGQFYASELARFQDMNVRMFKRLERDHDGVLSLQEYAASEEKLFARLDRNNDGTITQDETRPRFASKGERSQEGKSRRRG